jgi:hypothetical protein
MDGLMSEKSHCLCDETFVIDELQSRECQIVISIGYPSTRNSPE